MLKNITAFYVFGIILPVVASLFLIGVPPVLLFDVIPSEFVLNHGLKIFGSEAGLENVHIDGEIVDLGALFEKRYLESGKSFEKARDVQGWVWNNRPSVFAGILLYIIWSLGVVAASIWAFLHAQSGYTYKKEEWRHLNQKTKNGIKDKFTSASYTNYLNDMDSHSLGELKYINIMQFISEKNLRIKVGSSPDSYIGLSSIMNFSGNLIAQYKVNKYIDVIKEALKKEELDYMFSFQSSRNFHITLREYNHHLKSNPRRIIKKVKEIERTYTKVRKLGVLSGRVKGVCLDKSLGFFVRFDETNFAKYSNVSKMSIAHVNWSKQLFARVNFASLIDCKNEKDFNRVMEILKCFDNKTIGTAYFDKIEAVSFSKIHNYVTLLSKDLKNGELHYFNENYKRILNNSRIYNDRPIPSPPCVPENA